MSARERHSRGRGTTASSSARTEEGIWLSEERAPLPRLIPARGRRGRGIVEGWALAVAVVAIVALGFAGVSAAVRSSGGRRAAGASASDVAEKNPTPTAVWAHMKSYGVKLHFPASPAEMVAVGYHQAWNTRATDMLPQAPVHPRDTYASTKAALKAVPALKMFLMMSRGRGASEYSAADCAVRPGATVLSPVDGVVTLVKTYHLVGYGTDYRVEIEADGASPVRLVMIHLRDVRVKPGMRVDGGVSPIATVRHLPIDSQVNRYVPVVADHTHIQINNVGYTLSSGG